MAERLAGRRRRRHRVEPHARSRRSRSAQHGVKIAHNLTDLAACDVVFCMVSTWDDVQEVIDGPHGLLSGGGPAAEAGRRMLVDLARGFGAVARAARGARRGAARGAGERQCQGDQGRPSLVRVLGPKSRVRAGAAAAQADCAERELRRRRRARAHRQDLPQRLPRRGHAIAGRDHRARAEGGRAAARVPRVHEPERDGLDVHALQDAGVREPRFHGRRSRRSCCARTWTWDSMPAAGSACRCRSPRSRASWWMRWSKAA